MYTEGDENNNYDNTNSNRDNHSNNINDNNSNNKLSIAITVVTIIVAVIVILIACRGAPEKAAPPSGHLDLRYDLRFVHQTRVSKPPGSVIFQFWKPFLHIWP